MQTACPGQVAEHPSQQGLVTSHLAWAAKDTRELTIPEN